MAVAVEDMDDVGLDEVERGDEDPARRIGRNAFGVARTRRKRSETHDPAGVRQRRPCRAECEESKQWEQHRQYAPGHDLLPENGLNGAMTLELRRPEVNVESD